MSDVSVIVIDHPRGCLLQIRHNDNAVTLDREEACDLYEQLAAKLGQMPVKLKPE